MLCLIGFLSGTDLWWEMIRVDLDKMLQGFVVLDQHWHFKDSFPMAPLACQPSIAHKLQMFVKGIIRKQTHFLSLTHNHAPTSPLNHETFPLSLDCSFFSLSAFLPCLISLITSVFLGRWGFFCPPGQGAFEWAESSPASPLWMLCGAAALFLRGRGWEGD